ncbi:MAG: pantoate--beta-alanine ligase [Kiritimatiellae bacterium]|nr:pantoate--beta-alanine ligase [Kiritimatiellia bacterium]
MKTVRTKKSLSRLSRSWHEAGQSVALVPTMGYLHEGHLSLVRLARKKADRVVVSVFVNPTQFGPNEDFAKYPRDEKRDFALLAAEGVDAVFAPTPQEMYGADATVRVVESSLSKTMCGAFRPIHFSGVMTVVLKLFNASRCDVAVFGEKDAQQLSVIRRMVRDLDVPVKIVGAPLVREADGLARSSRNVYLSEGERARALSLSAGLDKAREDWLRGNESAARAVATVRKAIGKKADKIDYVVAVDPDTLEPVAKLERGTLVAVAAWFGSTRLIDNHFLRR